MSDNNDTNPATGLPMIGATDSGGNFYGFNNGFRFYEETKKKKEQDKTPCTDDEFAHRLLAIVLTFSFFFMLFVIVCSLK